MANWRIDSLFRSVRDSRESEAHAIWRLSPGVHASLNEDGLVLLHVPTGRVYRCNRTGARIWQGLSSGLTPDFISHEISRDYNVDETRVRSDTSVFLAELQRRGFVST